VPRKIFDWTKKLHMYAGLLTFTAFVVWGIAGIHAVFLPPPGASVPPEISSTKEVAYEPQGGMDDTELAKDIYENIDIPLRGGHYNIHRDEDGHLAFFVFTPSGRRDITYLEDQGLVHIDVRENDVADFLSSMHTHHSRRGPSTFAARVWGVYNEFATWAFFFMTLSGVYLWIDTRPGMRWAQLTAATSIGTAVALWLATR
jgi:hypothetical protein